MNSSFMPMRLFFYMFLCLGFASAIQAQDLIYTISGSKFLAKITEINTTDVKYKDFSNPDGPTYVISKTEVVLVKFSDGSTQIVNENPPALTPKHTDEKAVVVPNKKPLNLYYLSKNMLSINALSLANADVTILYDRELLNSKLCLTFLGGYNFNPNIGGLNAPILNSWGTAKKKYDLGFGISFTPGTRRVQYAVGLLGKYMAFNYQDVSYVNGQSVISTKNGTQLAVMISNGLLFRVTPNFNFKFFGAVGVPSYSPSLIDNSYQYLPKVYLGYCFGYRF